MNRLDEMDFHQIKLEYQRIFNFIDNTIFEKISSEIESIYQEYIFWDAIVPIRKFLKLITL